MSGVVLRVVTPTTAGQLGSDLSAWFKTKDIVHGCFARMKKDRLKKKSSERSLTTRTFHSPTHFNTLFVTLDVI